MEPEITLQINSWTGLLQAGLILLLLILVSAWLGYSYGCRKVLLWQEAMNHIPLGVVIFNTEREVLFKNNPASTLLKELPPNTIERVGQVRTRDNPYAVQIKGLEGDQVNLQAWALGEKHSGVLLLLRNITREPDQEADQKFVFDLAHGMASPLSYIGSTLKAASNDKVSPAERYELLQKGRKQVEDMIRLVSNLRFLELLDSGKSIQPLRLYKITDVAYEVVEQLSEQAKARQIHLILEPSPNLPLVEIDVEGWRQVFQNLIGNSIKYGKQGGTIRIEIQQPMSELLISVSDDGPGIPADDLGHLFKRGFRGSSSGDVEGNGLGLSIVRRVVEQHGGEIYPASEPSRGTTFHITLPIDRQV